MTRTPAVLVFGCAILWASAADAGCSSEMRCDSAGVCAPVEVCDNAVDMVHASPDAMTPIPPETDPLAATPVAATATDAGCREVDICGTMTMVCD